MNTNDVRFRNRRRMAWTSFWFMLIVGGWMLWKGVTTDEGADRIEKLSFLLGTLFGMCTSIIVSYFTASTITQVNDLRFGPLEEPQEGGSPAPAPTPAPAP